MSTMWSAFGNWDEYVPSYTEHIMVNECNLCDQGVIHVGDYEDS